MTLPRPAAVIMGFDTHMILETVPILPSTRQNAHQIIDPTSRHYAEALPRRRTDLRTIMNCQPALPVPCLCRGRREYSAQYRAY